MRDAVELLAERGPTLGRLLADRITGSRLHTQRQAVLLVAGDKSGRWTRWYDEAIKLAEDRYDRYLATPPEEIQ